MEKELRFLNTEISLREEGEGKKVLEGRAIPFNSLSEDLGGFKERISPGAFPLDEGIKSFWSHDSRQVLGSTKSETLRVEERSDGIHFSLDLPDTTTGRDAFELIRRGDVDGVSFGFMVNEDRIDQVDGQVVRTVLNGRLIEISPVAFPAYPQTRVAAELRERIDSVKEEEEETEESILPISVLEAELELLELEE